MFASFEYLSLNYNSADIKWLFKLTGTTDVGFKQYARSAENFSFD